ncbi:hypothetical protein JAAARDRAFT_31221 [Jaapia argillacea MUCL 33604]|uniref:GAR domain-containing protein n=1 Tax=Jaapia argillacea MUCL 33604 TaxID=933084 RepID=A0A067Q427_9AGAM|nr:hypothetical protein JAAARDRAFT_31221 [Jaapia argillacea MUCL 33604]
MVSIRSASSSRSSLSSSSQHSLQIPPSPSGSSGGSSASSSKWSLNTDDEENVTITARPSLSGHPSRKSQEDLQLLAVSSRITELSYSISDIQTRIFEIQELRHQTQSSGDVSHATGVIDQALINLDERLESVAQGIKSVSETLEPLLQAEKTPTQPGTNGADNENAGLLRKHAALLVEWEGVQSESDVLREELKEDKWLTVFRTATEQAEGMMTSLEKAVNRCQHFIWQVHRRGHDDSPSPITPKLPVNMESFTQLLDAFEAKKKHYMPATTKVLSIIDKGVQDRVTKNGECLRRHAECNQRWRNLRDRITQTELEMEGTRQILLSPDLAPSESGSSNASKSTHNGYLASPPMMKSRAPSAASQLSESVSPFRRFAKKLTGRSEKKAPPISTNNTPSGPKHPTRTPSSEPTQTLRHRSSMFPFRIVPPTPISPMSPATPDRPSHKYSQSLTPESSPKKLPDTNLTMKGNRPVWNSSTKVEPPERPATLKSRRPSAAGLYGPPGGPPPTSANGSPYKRSLSRSSMGSSRPWSPVTSSISTAPSSNPSIPPMPFFRPPSRSQDSRLSVSSPRSRPKTPSQIPAPKKSTSPSSSDDDWDDEDNPTTLMQRAFSPGPSTSTSFSSISSQRSQTPNGTHIPAPRPPSRSMIPLPSFQVSTPSRPGTAMSDYRPGSSMSFRSSALRAQTPESSLRERAQQIARMAAPTPRPSVLHKMPPSSFKDSTMPRTPVSRPSSRTAGPDPAVDQNPVYLYVPSNPKDPLEAEVASIVNSIPHGLLVERIDPPARTVPKEGEEIKAIYAFTNALARKVVNVRLATMTRPGSHATTKKVMCRVGGGWQDLHLYMLNRQAGL